MKTPDDRQFPTRQHGRLQPMGVSILCHSQCFALKPECFINLSQIVMDSAQCLNRSCAIGNRGTVSNYSKKRFGFVGSTLSVDSEPKVIGAYLAGSIHRQIHQYAAHFFEPTQIASPEVLLC